jgi:hypothetical protein
MRDGHGGGRAATRRPHDGAASARGLAAAVRPLTAVTHGTCSQGPAVIDRAGGQAVAGRWHGHGGGGVGLRTWRSRRSPRRAVRRLATHGGVWRRPLLTLRLAPSPATHLLSITALSTSCGGGGPIYCGSAGSATQSPRYHGVRTTLIVPFEPARPVFSPPRPRSRSREAKCQCTRIGAGVDGCGRAGRALSTVGTDAYVCSRRPSPNLALPPGRCGLGVSREQQQAQQRWDGGRRHDNGTPNHSLADRAHAI